MSANSVIFGFAQKARNLSSLSHRSFTVARIIYDKPSSTVESQSSSNVSDVPGLSGNVLKVTSDNVGPGAGKATNYKNPEYFCYNNTSYFEAEVEMLKYRLPQPSNKKASN